MTLYSYPTCSTCQKAKKWLNDHQIDFKDIHIVESPPDKAELKEIYQISELPLKKLFNTSGKRYRELGMKDKIGQLTEDELLRMLADDGMLIKRPLMTDGSQATVGFNEKTFESVWAK